MRHWIIALGIIIVTGAFLPVYGAARTAPQTPGTIIPQPDADMQVLRAILWQQDDRIDLAKAEITLDHLIDPSVDQAAELKAVDHWADRVRNRIPAGATTWAKVMAIYTTIYVPGPWNDGKKFDYNFDDPFGKDVHTTMLSNYLATRRGNCVSMPIFFAILAQRIGLQVTLATAPNHLLVKVKLDDGQWKNIEATSGSTLTDQEYMQRFQITQTAVENGLYLRPLSMREAVVAMATPFLEDYAKRRTPEQIMAMADLALSYDPKDVGALMMKALAYDKQVTIQYRSKYPDPRQLSPAQQADYRALMDGYFKIADQLQAMGWHRRSAKQDAEYMQAIQKAKTAENGG
ncbi:transglutaminase family protein [Dyella sp. M7H15-1]|uniref:transglutaminase family protein n=1 Tax=Dyella sp. M7H15-1 TaxID=2501295 RepID=UPI0013E8C6D4|nr:transglutaminase family protein [Dyella sp. M7H15-1]